MQYISHYSSPLGKMLLAGSEAGLTGLWFEGQKYFPRGLDDGRAEGELPLFETARRWLDIYFSGREPDFSVPLRPAGSEFRREVWKILCAIPYGKTMTYGEIGKVLAERRGLASMSAQAVGGAVGRNPVSIFIPCHRVVGADGSLTGYAGGIHKKEWLLRLEGADLTRLFIPQKAEMP